MSDVVPTFERMAAVTVPPEDVLVRRPPRVLGARQNPKTSTVHTQSIFCYLPGYPPDQHPRTLIGAARAASARWNAGPDATKRPPSCGTPCARPSRHRPATASRPSAAWRGQ
ncbi:hypothetical protein GTV15_04550 [Streptomyces sp. SID7803]|nr:hypothetical protein [Streptomyces sp. SID7803]